MYICTATHFYFDNFKWIRGEYLFQDWCFLLLTKKLFLGFLFYTVCTIFILWYIQYHFPFSLWFLVFHIFASSKLKVWFRSVPFHCSYRIYGILFVVLNTGLCDRCIRYNSYHMALCDLRVLYELFRWFVIWIHFRVFLAFWEHCGVRWIVCICSYLLFVVSNHYIICDYRYKTFMFRSRNCLAFLLISNKPFPLS